MKCPCGTGQDYEQCCGQYISGAVFPETAEKLMRSRYTAYTRVDMDYIEKTLAPESKHDYDSANARLWAEQSTWKGLKILSTEKGEAEDKKGTVEFTAVYEHDGQGVEHHEVSQFRRDSKGRWLFVDGDSHTHKEGEGHQHKAKTVIREEPKTGRNDPCVCGSGKKFKKCCGVAA
jgi:SEC-C motif domain protein